VHGRSRETAAQELCEALKRVTGVELHRVVDDAVVDGDLWRFREEWASRPTLLLGSIYDNRALLGLACRRVVGGNSVYPGPGRYELRTLFSPLRRGIDVVVLAAVDEPCLSAGMARLAALTAQQAGGSVLPATIEIGGPDGVHAPSRKSKGGFRSMAYEFVWNRSAPAAGTAREHLLAEMAKRPEHEGLWRFRTSGHYSWEKHYLALLQFLASGYLSQDEATRVTRCLLPLALRNTDYTSVSALNPKSDVQRYTRHCMSGLASQYLLHEYLHFAAPWPKDGDHSAERGQVARNYSVLRQHLRALAERMRYRMESSEGFSTMETLSNLTAMYLHTGESAVVEAGVFRKQMAYAVAMRDNLGSDPGTNAYIACRPGAQIKQTVGGAGIVASAFFDGDPQTVWLYRHHGLPFTYLGVVMPPGMLAPRPDAEEAYPARYAGLSVIPHDPWFYGHYVHPNEGHPLAPGESVVAYAGPPERAFSKAVLRDGFERDDAYVLLQGENIGPSFRGAGPQGNAIVRFTEFGSLLLYQNVQNVSSWVRSVVSISRGQHDPMAAACTLDASFETAAFTGVSSRLDPAGGAAWTRHLVHRRGGYFAVLDEVAIAADRPEPEAYNMVCRWRSYHPGRMADDRRFTAEDGQTGVKLHLVSATPLPTSVTFEPRDGAARPTIVRQSRSGRHAPGSRVTFQNVFYAEAPSRARVFDVRRQSDRAMLVKGHSEGFHGIDLVGVGPLQLPDLLTCDSALCAIGPNETVFAGCRSMSFGGQLRVEASAPVTVVIAAQESYVEAGERVRVRVSGARLAGEAEAGRHALVVNNTSDLLAEIARRLEEMWQRTSDAVVAWPDEAESFPHKLSSLARISPDYRAHYTVHADADPQPLDGHPYSWARDPFNWVDRAVPWLSPTVPGWESGEGTVVLDLRERVAIRALRFIWPGHYQSHRFKGKVLEPDELRVEVRVSDDCFAEDSRLARSGQPKRGWHYVENAHYMSTARFPCLTIPVGMTARYVRAKVGPRPSGRRARVLFSEIEVLRDEPESRAGLRLRAAPNAKPGDFDVAVWSQSKLVLLDSRSGQALERELPAPVVDLHFADIDGDQRQEVLIYTLDDVFAALAPDGRERFRRELGQFAGGRGSWLSRARPACFAAWRPDAKGRLETIFFPHYSMMRVSPEPDLSRTWPKAGHTWGGKAAFTIPDLTGDGRDDLVVVGTYSGRAVRVLASDSALEEGQCHILRNYPFTGYSSGNMELPQYFDGHVVRDGKSWKAVVTLTPGGLDCFAAPDFKPTWRHFNHPPNLCSARWRRADAAPAVVLGRADGFVCRYAIDDGTLTDRVFIGRDVRAVAPWGARLAAGGSDGLVLLDEQCRVCARLRRPVDALATADGRLIVAFSDGEVAVCR